jgi:hypothetical protein
MDYMSNNQSLLVWINQNMSNVTGGESGNNMKLQLLNAIDQNDGFSNYNKWLYKNFIEYQTADNPTMGLNWFTQFTTNNMEKIVEFLPFVRGFVYQNMVINGL